MSWQNSMDKGVFSEDAQIAGALNSFIGKHALPVGGGCHILFPESSPITELAEKWMKEANKKIGGVGTVKARKMLEQVDKLKVYGIQGNVYGLKSKVGRHLNVMYNLGNDLMFWLIALLGTPFIYNFYDTLNPVMRYAHFINDPAWRPLRPESSGSHGRW